MLQMQHFASFSRKFKSNLTVNRVFFLLNACLYNLPGGTEEIYVFQRYVILDFFMLLGAFS
jgi:hypothetical protein